MPKLQRQDYYDTARDMNWAFSYVKDEDVFPEELSKSFGIVADEWWSWDEPYKLTYREYVHNQDGKDAGIYSIRSTIARSKIYENLDVGWKSAIKAHYGAIPVPEYFASIGEARMVRFGRAAAWRNMATFGTLDDIRWKSSFPGTTCRYRTKSLLMRAAAPSRRSRMTSASYWKKRVRGSAASRSHRIPPASRPSISTIVANPRSLR